MGRPITWVWRSLPVWVWSNLPMANGRGHLPWTGVWTPGWARQLGSLIPANPKLPIVGKIAIQTEPHATVAAAAYRGLSWLWHHVHRDVMLEYCGFELWCGKFWRGLSISMPYPRQTRSSVTHIIPVTCYHNCHGHPCSRIHFIAVNPNNIVKWQLSQRWYILYWRWHY